MMGARTGDRNAPVAGEKPDGLAHRTQCLSSSGAIKKCLSRPERSLPSCGPFSFIKIMIGAYTEALIIPPKARPKLKCLLDRNVCLEDSEMQTYLVTVSVFNGALAFRHGWDRFLSDHCIEYGEVVVFNYTRGLKFSVQIYGKSGCERMCFLRSCQTKLKRKRDEVETSNFNLLHRGSKTFDTLKEHDNSNLEATTREMSSDIAQDFSNSEQPSCGAVTEPYVDGNIFEKSGIQHDNIKKPKIYSVENQDTTPCELTVEDPIWNLESKTGSINDPMATEQGIDNPENSFYYARIDLSKGSEAGKTGGSKANKMKGLKANKKSDPSKGQLLSAMTSVTSQDMFRKNPIMEIEMKETVVPVCSNTSTMYKAKYITRKSIKIGLKEGKPLGDINSGNPDKLAVTEGKVRLEVESGQEKHKSSNICADNVNQFASAVGAAFHSGYLQEPKNRENVQSSAAELLGNTIEVDKVPCTKEASTYSATNSTVRHNNEAATLLSGCNLEHLTMLDGSSCRFIVTEDGICFVVEEDLIIEPNLSTIIPIEIDDSDMGIERCKEISPDHNHMSERPFVEPQVKQSFNDTQFTCNPKKHNEKQQRSSEPMKSPECHEKTALVRGSSQLVSEENMNTLVARKGIVGGALVKVESVDSTVLSAINPVKLILPITIPAQPWLELPAALPLKGKKDGGKVVILRDHCMRTWPVLYHESYKFIGFLGGWFALASANNLQPGDSCELEVLAELDMILVHIKEQYEST